MKYRGLPLILVCGAWGVFWGAWSALLPALKDQLGASTADLGAVLAAVPVGAIPAMAATGRLARGRERDALFLACAAFGLSVAAVGWTSSLVALGAALLVLGAASGALDVALNLATGRAERETGRRLFQPVHAAFPLGVILAAPATGLARQLGLGTTAVLAALGALVLAASASLLLLPLGRGAVGAGTAGGRRRWRAAALLGGLTACALVIENAVEQWSVLLLEDHRAASALAASAAPAVYMGAQTVGRLAAQALPRLPQRALHLVAGLGGGAGIALAGWGGPSGSVPVSLAGFALTGLALGPLVPAVLSRAAADDPSGALVSSVSVVSYTAFVVSPPLVAGLAAWLGLPAALSALALLALPLLARAAVAR
ncbi:MFS transporter [Nonomuraea sp. SMC257]|uniref:MFS transporter n=1 Tax=Nonomuraea montanisoli TaxID=2741721 RepID=A0A7Y6I3W3_9ACTN|nr:MFS transporter [Nonomuraea montanisoli]NUW30668.1 MFS transporter [Nonomuraea montanisoli]